MGGFIDFSLSIRARGEAKSLFSGISTFTTTFPVQRQQYCLCRLTSVGPISLRTDSQSNLVERTVAVIILIHLLSSTSTLYACALFNHVEMQYSAQEYTKVKAVVCKHAADETHVVPMCL